MKMNFLQRCLGISLILGIVLFGTSFLIRTTSTANAAPSSKEMIEGDNGHIMMNYTTTVSPATEAHAVKIYYEVMVWNTATGRSKLYYYDYDIDNWKAYGYQLPSNPME